MAKVHTNIRMDEDLHKWLASEAKKENRTFTNYLEMICLNHRVESRSSDAKKRPVVTGKISNAKLKKQQ